MRGIKLEHTLDQVLEVVRKEFIFAWLVLAVSFPKKVSSVGSQHFIEWVILFVCLVEWRMLGDKNEQDSSRGEDIDSSTMVLLSLQKLWSHVSLCSKRSLKVS